MRCSCLSLEVVRQSGTCSPPAAFASVGQPLQVAFAPADPLTASAQVQKHRLVASSLVGVVHQWFASSSAEEVQWLAFAWAEEPRLVVRHKCIAEAAAKDRVAPYKHAVEVVDMQPGAALEPFEAAIVRSSRLQ